LKKNNFTEAIDIAQQTFVEKQEKVKAVVAKGKKASSVKQIRFPNLTKDYPSLYRLELYKAAFLDLKENTK